MTSRKKQSKRPTYPNLHALIPKCLDSVVFDADGISGHARLQDVSSRSAVVFGDNASGKSLMLTVMRAFLGPREESGEETFSISMRTRTSSGMGPMFMYLDENYSSTGAGSMHAVMGAFHNARARKHPVWLMFDEPDIGLSDKFAAALGAYFAQEINTLPAHVKGVVIVTHSRPLLRRLLAKLDAPPHDVAMGPQQSLQQYLDADEEASVEELLALRDQAGTTMKGVMAILHDHGG
jgi:hypothetical protein